MEAVITIGCFSCDSRQGASNGDVIPVERELGVEGADREVRVPYKAEGQVCPRNPALSWPWLCREWLPCDLEPQPRACCSAGLGS